MQPICAQYITLSHFGSYLKIVLTIAQSNYITGLLFRYMYFKGCSFNRALGPQTIRPYDPGPKLNIFTWQDFVVVY